MHQDSHFLENLTFKAKHLLLKEANNAHELAKEMFLAARLNKK